MQACWLRIAIFSAIPSRHPSRGHSPSKHLPLGHKLERHPSRGHSPSEYLSLGHKLSGYRGPGLGAGTRLCLMGSNGNGNGQQQQQRQYWLLKTEPESWSWQNQEENKGLSVWDGVRNPQAQKLMKSMCVDDLCLFYHTGKLREVAGIVRVVKTFYPDPTDDSGKWGAVDVREVEALKQPVTLAQMRADDHFKDFLMLRQPRLSVVPVEDAIWRRVCELGGSETAESVGLKEAASSSVKKKNGRAKGASGKAENGVSAEAVKTSTARSKRNSTEEQPIEATGNGKAESGARTRGSKAVLDRESRKKKKPS